MPVESACAIEFTDLDTVSRVRSPNKEKVTKLVSKNILAGFLTTGVILLDHIGFNDFEFIFKEVHTASIAATTVTKILKGVI